MRGLRKYIRKHGWHFTVELAMDIMDYKWDADEVRRTTDKVAYYNVSKATLGDMVFWFNLFAGDIPKGRCMRYCLEMVGGCGGRGQGFQCMD